MNVKMSYLAVAQVAIVWCLLQFQTDALRYATDKVNVHLVPHSHDDTGWQVTVDQYYYQSVQYILDTVTEELVKDEKRRFIYVEMAFFERWWAEQDDQTRNTVKKLVEGGQLEFINGGWCMNDEGATHYVAIVDQMTEGFLFLENEFGPVARPRIGWHIDPFGHSNAQASLFAQMAFDGFFFARIDYQDFAKRANHSTLELVWRGSQSLGSELDIFTGVTWHGYGPPSGFCYDTRCGDTPIQDDSTLEDFNVGELLTKFQSLMMTQNNSYVGQHVMVTMGSDFQYTDALEWYKNLDKLIAHGNANESLKLNLFYSTPSQYLQAKYDMNRTWTLKTDDFMPLSSSPWAYWSGFFTSRPALKYYSRWASNFLQVCKQLEVIAGPYSGMSSLSLRRALGVLQHHDAITGTEKQVVAYDYAYRISNASKECEMIVSQSLAKLMSSTHPVPTINFCFLRNVSICPHTDVSTSFVAIVYNPLARQNTWPIWLPISSSSADVYGPDGQMVKSEVLPVDQRTIEVRGKRGNAGYSLVFQATAPAVGFSTYFIYTNKIAHKPKRNRGLYSEASSIQVDTFSIENKNIRLTFSNVTGLLLNVENLVYNVSVAVNQQLRWYNASAGNNVNSTQASGAYVFRPNSSETYDIAPGGKVTYKVVQTDVVKEVHQTFANWATQVIRLYDNSSYAEFEYTVGPIPFQDNLGKEIISIFSSDLETSGTFYTDANGREMQKRIRDHRDTFKINLTEPISSNYYPVNSRIAIVDSAKGIQLTVLTDRSHGGSSLQDGAVELMVHRRLLYDDHFGVGEALNETGLDGKGLIVRGSHYLQVAPIQYAGRMHRELGERIFAVPHVGIAQTTSSPQQWAQMYNVVYSGLKQELEPNIHFMTLQDVDGDAIIRVENQFAVGEDSQLSTNATVPPLETLFSAFTVSYVTEMTLGANLPKKEEERLHFKVVGEQQYGQQNHEVVSGPYQSITLRPMEIRTFRTKLQR